MKTLPIIICLSFLALYNYSQAQKARLNIDSLIQVLNEPAHDTVRGHILLQVSNAYLQINLDTSFLFSSQAHDLFERVQDSEGMGHASNLQAIVYARQRKFDEAIQYFERALSRFRDAGNRARELRTLSNLATSEHDRGEYQNASRYFEKIDALYQETNDSAGRAVNYFNWARTLITLNDLDQGEAHLILASELNNEAADWATACRIHSMLGQLSYARGSLAEAESYTLKALAVAQGRNAPLIEAQSYQFLGVLKLDQGEFQQAIEHYTEAEQRFEQGGRIDGVVACKIGLGNVYMMLAQPVPAKAIYEEALTLAKQIGDQRSSSIAVSNLAEIAINLGEYDEAWAYMIQTLDYWKAQNSILELGKTYGSLARIELGRERLEQAILFCDTAISLLENTGHHQPLATVFQIMGEVLREQGQFEASELAFGYVLANARQVNALKTVRDYHYESGLLYVQMGEFEKAASHYKKYIDLNDSLFTSSISDNAGKYEAMYWTEKKQHELEISQKSEELQTQAALAARLERDNISTQRNYIIAGSILLLAFSFFAYRFYSRRKRDEMQSKLSDLELKALRAQINPHFLFNALSGVQNMIDKNELRSASISLARCAKLTRLILEHSEKETVTLEDELLSIKMYIELEALRFPFEYEVHVDENLDQQEVEVPSMLIQPFIENAILHGLRKKEKNGLLKVSVSPVPRGILFVVEDNGVGREAHSASSDSDHQPMGVNITTNRIAKLHDNQEYDVEPMITDLHDELGNATGTRVEVLIPIKNMQL